MDRPIKSDDDRERSRKQTESCLCSMQTTKRVDQNENGQGDAEHPQQQITSHDGASGYAGIETWSQFPLGGFVPQGCAMLSVVPAQRRSHYVGMTDHTKSASSSTAAASAAPRVVRSCRAPSCRRRSPSAR